MLTPRGIDEPSKATMATVDPLWRKSKPGRGKTLYEAWEIAELELNSIDRSAFKDNQARVGKHNASASRLTQTYDLKLSRRSRRRSMCCSHPAW